MFDVLVYALLRKYIKDSLVGAGALKGASCQIQSIVRNETDDANIVTYKWEDNNGVSHTSQMIVHDGAIPTVDVGTVKTVSYNKPAKVIPKETETGVELDFEIPQGEPGEGGGEATNIFVGTMDEWNALTVSEKEQYTVVNITDDEQYVFTSKFLEKTTTMPLPSADNLSQHRLYVGDTTAQYIKGAIYECQVVAGADPVQYKWEPISSADVDIATPAKAGVVKPDDDTIKIDANGTIRAEGVREFVGTIEEWEALSATEKAKYGIVVIDDSEEQVVFGSAAFKGATDIVRPNNHNLVESNAVYSAIANAISSAFEPHGSITVAELTPSLLTTENLGNVYTISDSGVTNEYFLQGANVPISAKDGVSIVKAGADTILFNLSPGIFDLSSLQSKSLTQSIAGESTVEGALGAVADDISDVQNVIPSDASASNKLATENDIFPKTYGNLDANNCTEPGYYASINYNAPVNGYSFTLFVELSLARTYCHQTAKLCIADDEPSVTYVRKGRYINDAWAWSSWRKLVTENDIPKTNMFVANDSYKPSTFGIMTDSTSGFIEFEQTVHNGTSEWPEGYIKGIWDISNNTIQIVEQTSNSGISAIIDTYNSQACVKIIANIQANAYKLTKAIGYGGAVVDRIRAL